MKPEGSTRDDPYGDNRPYHKAAKISEDGKHIAPLCSGPKCRALRPRERWTIAGVVTCKRCLRRLATRLED